MLSKKHPKSSLKESKSCHELEGLNGVGTYTLVILVPAEARIGVGALGTRSFSRGYYAYTGTAFGKNAQSLAGRILRHLGRDKKKKRWHIDYLLAASNVEVTSAIAAFTEKKMECEINQHLRDRLQATIPARGFGSSDCRKRCGSHLLYLGLEENVAKRIADLYSEKTEGAIHLYEFRRTP